jgi:hypothetical protein
LKIKYSLKKIFLAAPILFALSGLAQNSSPLQPGNVGIGTTSPITPLQVVGKASFGELVTSTDVNRSINVISKDAVLKIVRVHQTYAPSVELISRPATPQGAPDVAYWDMYTQPSDATFRIRDRLGTVDGLDMLTITHSTGNIGIGTTDPKEKLSVNGNIRTKKLIVTQTGWPDYVFSTNYKLRSLHSLEAFINKNKHLPDVPSDKEVEKAGVDVGATQAALLKKIEELTLYVINQDKKQENLQRRVKQLESNHFKK